MQETNPHLRAAILEDGRMFEGGKLEIQPAAKKLRSFAINGKDKSGLSISSTEHYSLPRVFPGLEEVNVYLGWFGASTKLMHRFAKTQNAFLKIPAVKNIMAKLVSATSKSRGVGPEENSREKSRSMVVAEAFDASGKLLSRADCEGVNGYNFTARFIAWAAHQFSTGAGRGAGALGPVETFGLDLLTTGCNESGIDVKITLP